jgi:crotonobetainyl-CoA:carnitine CoA-transferase CaiB-like acyl-CoA transferase
VTRSSDIRIVDFSTHLSGPLATHLLTELGANVIKVENPRTGDGNRLDGELIEGVGVMHLALNSGARSLTVDRRSAEWPEVVAACARWADAVVVGARPADARRRGMDFATMQASNPEIIYCSVSGFGDNGPWKDYTAHGQTIDTFAGLVPVDDGEVQPHTRPGWRTAGTTLGGVFAAMGVLAAMHRRDSGRRTAQYLSVSLWQAAMWWSWRDLTTLANVGTPWLDYSDLGSRYSLYSTADGRVMLLAPLERRFWERFCDILDLPDERRAFGTWDETGMCHGAGEAFDVERVLIAERIRVHPLDHWVPLFEQAEIPFAPLLTVREALESEHAEVNGVLRETSVNGTRLRIPAIPLRISDSDAALQGPLGPLSPPPDLGEQREELLRELGVRPAESRSADHR